MEKTKQKTRVLAYKLATEINLGDLESIAGGGQVDKLGKMSHSFSNSNPGNIDYRFDF